MKRIIYISAGLLIVYIVIFLFYSVSNTKIWSGDKKEYTYYSEDNEKLFIFHKPLLYIQYYLFNKPYVIGHHHDPDGNESGFYYDRNAN
jgi:hypothetical protein